MCSQLVGPLIATLGGTPASAQAATSVAPETAGIALPASCALGDIDVAYASVGAKRTTAAFTDDAGRVPDSHDEVPFAADAPGTEHILLDADEPVPPAGSIVGEHVMVGATEPTTTTSAGVS